MTVGDVLDSLAEYSRDSVVFLSPETIFVDEEGREVMSDPGFCVVENDELYLIDYIPFLDDLDVDLDADPYADDEEDEYPLDPDDLDEDEDD